MNPTLAVQRALLARGYDLGPSKDDGLLGRATIAAIAAFQAAAKLDIRYPGTIGPKTLQALGIANASPVEVPWLTEARRFLGEHEVRDAAKLDKALRLDASAIPWCGAFVGMVLATALPREPLPSSPLWALSWQKLGTPLIDPAVGAVVTFKRNGGGHVGFVVGHDKSFWHVLGGNQSNAVTVAKISKARQFGALRWPSTYPAPSGSRLAFSDIKAAVTHNEA